MTKAQIIEELRLKIVRLFTKYDCLVDCTIYANNTRWIYGCKFSDDYSEMTVTEKIEENVDVSEYLEYCNPDTISIAFDGSSLYEVMNYHNTREYVRNYRPDLVANIEVARTAYKAKQEEQREARAAERKAERIAEAERCNAEFMEVINKAIAILKNGGCVENQYIDLMENPDEAGYHEYKHYTTFTYLFDKYGIKLPIRTRGFVIDRLASVTYNAEKQSMQYSYMRKGNSKGSSKLYDYLYTLVDKIKNESEEV